MSSTSKTKYVSVLIGAIMCLSALTIWGIRFFLLDKGIIFSDDAWYLILLRDMPKEGMITRYFLLFKQVFNNDIYGIRLFVYLSHLISALILAYSLWRYQKKADKGTANLAYCLGAATLGMMILPDVPSINYITLNQTVGLIATSALAWYATDKNRVALIIAGFILSIVFATQITCLVAIPVTMLFVYMTSENKWKDITAIIAGSMLFFLYYFTTVETPAEIYAFISEQTTQTVKSGGSQYGIFFLVKWIVKTIFYVAVSGISATIAFCTVRYCKKKLHSAYTVVGIQIALYLACYFASATIINHTVHSYSNNHLLDNGLTWYVLVLLLLTNWKQLSRQDLYLVATLAVMPAALSFGTNIDFRTRQSAYLFFNFVTIFVCLRPTLKQRAILCVVFAVPFVHAMGTINGCNWHGDKILEQTISLKEVGVGQNIKVDKSIADRLTFAKKHLKAGDRCLCVYETWGIAELLELKPISYDFSVPDTESLNEIIGRFVEENPEEPLYVIFNNSPYCFAPSEIDVDGVRTEVAESKDLFIIKCFRGI